MLKSLLESVFKTLCPKVFTRTQNRIREDIPSGQVSGTYTAPDNGLVKVTGHCVQCEVFNTSSGEQVCITSSESNFKSAGVFVKKGDPISWHLTEQQGRNTYLYFYYSELSL